MTTAAPSFLLIGMLTAVSFWLIIRDVWRSWGPRLWIELADRRATVHDLETHQRVAAQWGRIDELERSAVEAEELADDLILHGLDVEHPYLDRLQRSATELRGQASVLRGKTDDYLTPVWIERQLASDTADRTTVEPVVSDETVELPASPTAN